MKKLVFLLVLLNICTLNAQDTLSKAINLNKGHTYLIVDDKDTSLISTYPNGKIESKKSYGYRIKNQLYQRYYPDGRIMWSKYLNKGVTVGIAKYFNEKGKKVAEFLYDNGQIKDTVYLSENERMLFGRMTYYSVVYGGMEREDGQTNISGGPGVYINYPMYAVKMNPDKEKQVMYKRFMTDFDGYFFICLDKGSFGFFPANYDLSMVESDMGSPKESYGGSSSSIWNLQSPLVIDNKKYQYIELHFHSEGYAP